jgi:hypothetical protein
LIYEIFQHTFISTSRSAAVPELWTLDHIAIGMRIRLVILILSEVIIGYLMLAAPVFHDRMDLARAVVAYHTSPSSETEAELTRQRQITRHQQRLIFAVFGLFFAANTYALVRTVRRIGRTSSGDGPTQPIQS